MFEHTGGDARAAWSNAGTAGEREGCPQGCPVHMADIGMSGRALTATCPLGVAAAAACTTGTSGATTFRRGLTAPMTAALRSPMCTATGEGDGDGENDGVAAWEQRGVREGGVVKAPWVRSRGAAGAGVGGAVCASPLTRKHDAGPSAHAASCISQASTRAREGGGPPLLSTAAQYASVPVSCLNAPEERRRSSKAQWRLRGGGKMRMPSTWID